MAGKHRLIGLLVNQARSIAIYALIQKRFVLLNANQLGHQKIAAFPYNIGMKRALLRMTAKPQTHINKMAILNVGDCVVHLAFRLTNPQSQYI